jgi:hypothetical protein
VFGLKVRTILYKYLHFSLLIFYVELSTSQSCEWNHMTCSFVYNPLISILTKYFKVFFVNVFLCLRYRYLKRGRQKIKVTDEREITLFFSSLTQHLFKKSEKICFCIYKINLNISFSMPIFDLCNRMLNFADHQNQVEFKGN